MSREQILALLGAIEDAHDLCLMAIGIFCGPRASEALGLQWKCWTGDALMPHGTAYEGQFYKERLKTKASKAPIPVPDQVSPLIEAWKALCTDCSPEALMFPTFGRGERHRTGSTPRWKELPALADTAPFSEAGDSRSARHLSGDAPHDGNRHAKPRDAKGHAGALCVTPALRRPAMCTCKPWMRTWHVR